MDLVLQAGMLIVRRQDMRVWKVIKRVRNVGSIVVNPNDSKDADLILLNEDVMTLEEFTLERVDGVT